MWTRKNLKDRGKRSFKANYWKTVLVAFVLTALLGCTFTVYTGVYPGAPGMAGIMAGSHEAASNGATYSDSYARDESLYTNGYSQQELDALYGETGISERELIDMQNDLESDDIDELPPAIKEMIGEGAEAANGGRRSVTTFGVAALALIGLFALVAIALAIALGAFLLNPLAVGGARFFLLNLNQQAKVREMGYAFDHNYRETVKTMFFRDLYTLLWSLLFVIPGIVKSYEYRMIPYLLAEDPAMTMDRAFAESKRMMAGNKWRAFVLDLSFIGWAILSALTLGILHVFYVGPYESMTDAALYEELRYGADDAAVDAAAVTEAAGDVPVPPFAQESAPESETMWDDGADDLANKGASDDGPEA